MQHRNCTTVSVDWVRKLSTLPYSRLLSEPVGWWALRLVSAGWYVKLTYSGSSWLIREAVNLFAKCILHGPVGTNIFGHEALILGILALMIPPISPYYRPKRTAIFLRPCKARAKQNPNAVPNAYIVVLLILSDPTDIGWGLLIPACV